MNIEKKLLDFYDSIKDVDENLCKISKTNTLIFENLAILKDSAKNCAKEKDVWKYNLSPLKIKLPKKPQCRPDYAENIDLTLEVGNEIYLSRKKNFISDPIKLLKFDIQIKCSKTNNLCSWHLDKHSQSSKEDDGENKYIHPEYHFSYGGKKMEERISDFGDTLLLRSPRLMHPPLDVILGIDFVINQFIPKEYAYPFITNPIYKTVVSEMKELIWKPFCLAFANNFYKKWGDGFNFEKGYSESLIG